MTRHSLLERQLKRCLNGVDTNAEPWHSFLKVVDEAYQGFDVDRRMTERSLDLSSAELMATNERLRESEERYELASRAASDGLWDWKLPAREVYFSTRWKAIIGHEEDDLTSSPEEWFSRVHPHDVERVRHDVEAHLAGRTALFENEHRIRHKSGSFRWVLTRGLAVRDASGVAIRFAGSQADITEGKVVDALTSLPNRMLLVDRLGRLLERYRRHGGADFAVLCLDLDGFKFVNESLGHRAGDELLQAIARRLEATLRRTDTVTRGLNECPHRALDDAEHTLARVGGDEFILLLNNVRSVVDTTRVADRIQEVLSSPFEVSGREVFASASIGIAVSAHGYGQPEEMLRDADTAMYRAKLRGKGRSEVFDEDMRIHVLERLRLDTEVRVALQRREFLPYFQPIIDLSTGRLRGFEALLRWRHPERGIVRPGEFIPIIEDNGLVTPVGAQFFIDVCEVMQGWQERHPDAEGLQVNINFASQQFLEPGLAGQLLSALRSTNLQPNRIVIEITESTAIRDFSLTADVLGELQRAGIGVLLDDFGTGYSSLACLHRLPITGLKLDPTFIRDEQQRPEIIQAVVALAHGLNLTVTAEGIETPQQCARLKALGCDFAQGYLFAHPLDLEAAARVISHDRIWFTPTSLTASGTHRT